MGFDKIKKVIYFFLNVFLEILHGTTYNFSLLSIGSLIFNGKVNYYEGLLKKYPNPWIPKNWNLL